MYFGRYLNLDRHHRRRGGINVIRQIVRLTHNPSSVNPGEILNEVLVPGSKYLSFKLTVTGGVLVNNIARCIIKSPKVGIEGVDVLTIDDCYILYSYMSQWESKNMKVASSHKKGVILWGGLKTNGLKKRLLVSLESVVTATETENMTNKVSGKKFYIPLDFECLQLQCRSIMLEWMVVSVIK